MSKTAKAEAVPPVPANDHAAPDAPAPSALTRTSSTDESAALAALTEAGIDAADGDGLTEVALTDLKTPYKLWNLKKADGVARLAQDQFLDTLDRTVSDSLNLVLLDMHKTNLYERFNSKEQRNETQCKSFDRVTGIWQADGHERPCKGCPDAQWRNIVDAQGQSKREQPCAEVWNVAAFDLNTQRVCLLKFKRTSLDAIKMYAQTHHIGRLPAQGGKPRNVPLYVYRVRATLEMHKSGNYAVPKLERGTILTPPDVRVMHETAAGVRETFEARMRAADESAAHDVVPDGDSSFNTAEFDAANAANVAERGKESFIE
jgi:hypothetical protein